MNTSYCTGCRGWKSLHRFHKDSHAPRGIRHRCKTCVSRAGMQYRLKKELLYNG